MKKSSAPGKFYKQTVQNNTVFQQKNSVYNKKKAKHRLKTCCWLKEVEKNHCLPKRFQRTELFAFNNFAV